MNSSVISKLIKRLGDKTSYSYTLAFLQKKRNRKSRQQSLKAFLDNTR